MTTMKEADDKSNSLLQWIYKIELIQLTANIQLGTGGNVQKNKLVRPTLANSDVETGNLQT